jgi:hypothetical protein
MSKSLVSLRSENLQLEKQVRMWILCENKRMREKLNGKKEEKTKKTKEGGRKVRNE